MKSKTIKNILDKVARILAENSEVKKIYLSEEGWLNCGEILTKKYTAETGTPSDKVVWTCLSIDPNLTGDEVRTTD